MTRWRSAHALGILLHIWKRSTAFSTLICRLLLVISFLFIIKVWYLIGFISGYNGSLPRFQSISMMKRQNCVPALCRSLAHDSYLLEVSRWVCVISQGSCRKHFFSTFSVKTKINDMAKAIFSPEYFDIANHQFQDSLHVIARRRDFLLDQRTVLRSSHRTDNEHNWNF